LGQPGPTGPHKPPTQPPQNPSPHPTQTKVCGGYNPLGFDGYGPKATFGAFLFTWPEGDFSQLPFKLPKIGSETMAVNDGLDQGVLFGPGDLKIPLARGNPRQAKCKVRAARQRALRSWGGARPPPARRPPAALTWPPAPLSPPHPTLTHDAHAAPPPPAPPPPNPILAQLIDYQKLPGGGKSLFNTKAEKNTTELVELRVYVRKGGKLKYELDGLRWKSSISDDGSGQGPPPGIFTM
jgi:hypothetical protein